MICLHNSTCAVPYLTSSLHQVTQTVRRWPVSIFPSFFFMLRSPCMHQCSTCSAFFLKKKRYCCMASDKSPTPLPPLPSLMCGFKVCLANILTLGKLFPRTPPPPNLLISSQPAFMLMNVRRFRLLTNSHFPPKFKIARMEASTPFVSDAMSRPCIA